jgi:Mrp family chromosome partitioning ATPase
MSRLLKALKRLDESGAGLTSAARPAESQVAAPPQPRPQPAPAAAPPPATHDDAPAPGEVWPSGDAAALASPPSQVVEPHVDTPAADPAPAVEPLPSASSRQPRSASPGRRASDRYRVAPQYAALCQAIVERVPRTRPTSILVVPATADVDAGTVAAEMALSMAQAIDLPIVAIDADIAADSADADAAVSTSGLSDVLFDGVDWRGVLAPARDNRVRLLTAGRPLARGDSIASATARLGPTASEIKTRYRYLIVHAGPPTNPLTAAWVQAADLIYLVVRLGQTTRRDARAAKRTLQRDGAIVHGSILLANA